MTDLQELQRRFGFAGQREPVARYQTHYVKWFAPGARVLDLGCGEGVFLELLAAQGRRGVGVDSSAGEVALARARGLEVTQGDGLAYLRAHPGEFDGVFSAHVIEHLPPQAAVELIETARAALKPGGTLVLITPDPLDLEVIAERFWLDLTHVRPYPRALLVGLVQALGFELVASGNDPRTGHGDSPGARVRRFFKSLTLGRHGWRGDTFVVARRPAGGG